MAFLSETNPYLRTEEMRRRMAITTSTNCHAIECDQQDTRPSLADRLRKALAEGIAFAQNDEA